MSMEEDLHMALCVVKVLALVVIAASLWSLSGAMGGNGFGYAADGSPAIARPTGQVQSTNLGPTALGWATERSQVAGFSNYEPPVFWNIGNISDYETQQAGEAKNLVNYDGTTIPWDVMRGVAGVASSAPKKGYYSGIAVDRGYAVPGISGVGQVISPNY